MSYIETFKTAASKISKLLDDRHPGLSTWNGFLVAAGQEFQTAASEIQALGQTDNSQTSGLDLDELHTEIKKLSGLLDQPEPGLSIWQDAVQRTVRNTSSMFLMAGVAPR